MVWRLIRMLAPHKVPIGIGFACLVLSTPAQMFHPLVWMYVVDDVIGKGRHNMLLPALGLMLAVHLAGTALNAARTWLLGRAGQRFVAGLRTRLWDKLLGQSMTYYHDRRSGEIVARVIGDVDTLQQVVINGVDSVLANILGLFWVAGIILWLNWKIGLLILMPLGVVAVATWVFNLRVRKLYRRIRDRLGDLSAHLQEHVQGIGIVKAFAREDYEREAFDHHNASYMNESLKGITARAVYFPGIMSIGFLSNIIMLGGGAWFVINGTFTVGRLVAYRGYWWHLFSPVFSLAQTNEMIQRAVASASRVFEVLDAPETVDDGPDALACPESSGGVTFDNVTFSYEGGDPILQGVGFEVGPGQKLGIVGPSGAGKSTVLNLILRFYDPDRGRVLLDGRDLTTLKQAELRRHMALVSQDPFLFNETILDNIRFGKLDASAEEVAQAARLANAHEFIIDLPKGYDTVVGERGVKLSGGQKQRICIARAFLANPALLLLDEATASVEPESEAVIIGALARLEQGRTAVIVSHRLSLVRDCDTIVVIEDGRISERGSHEELLAHGGWYARMYALQVTDAA